MRNIGFIAIAAAAMVIAAPAAASTYVQLNTVALFSGTGSSVSNNAININDGTVKVQVTAWTSTTPGYWNTSNGHIRSTLGQWDYGVGSQYSGSDSHTIDNTDRYDFILLQFDTKVALNTVTFTSGWDGYDSDATISYANVNNSSFSGTYKNTTSTFWNAASTQLRTNRTSSNTPNNSFVNGVVNTSRRQVNPTLVTNNVWLIAAKIGDNDTYRDAFKIKGFTYIDPTYVGQVPEPSTWAMLILGMGFVGGAMRRRNRTALALA